MPYSATPLAVAMNLYFEGTPEPLSLDQVVKQARSRARLRRAQRYLDETEERRDVALLVEAGLSLVAIAGHLMLSRHTVSKQLEAWSHLKADERLALDERGRQAIAATVLDEPLDEHASERLIARLSLLSDGLPPDKATDEPTAGATEVEWQLRQLERAREDGLLAAPQLAALKNRLAAANGAPSVSTDEINAAVATEPETQEGQ